MCEWSKDSPVPVPADGASVSAGELGGFPWLNWYTGFPGRGRWAVIYRGRDTGGL